MEGNIKACANNVKANEYEKNFDALISYAVTDYKEFLNDDGTDRLKSEMLTNFIDFFNTCIDIKKEEIAAIAVQDSEDENAVNNQN